MLHRRNLTTLVLTSAVAGWLVPSEAEAASGRELFAIARSKNANIVRYVARVNRQGTLDVRRPIEAHWVMRAEDGRREELSWAERNLAYGFTASNVESDGCTLSLVAFESRQVRIERRGAPLERYSRSGASARPSSAYSFKPPRALCSPPYNTWISSASASTAGQSASGLTLADWPAVAGNASGARPRGPASFCGL